MSKLTQEQIRDAYGAWMDVRNRLDDSSRAVIEAIAAHVQYAPVEPSPQAGASEAGVVDRMLSAFDDVAMGYCEFTAEARIEAMTAALNVALDAMEKEIQDEGDRISWRGFGAETTFAKAVRARLSASVRDPAERVTVKDGLVCLDGIPDALFTDRSRPDYKTYDVAARRYAAGLRLELDAARKAEG